MALDDLSGGLRGNVDTRAMFVEGSILRGEPLTIFGDGTQTRGFSHVSDVAPVIAGAIERPEAYDQTFNIGADRPCQRQSAGRDRQSRNGRSFPARLPAAAVRGRARACVTREGARLLGYRDAVGLEEGVTAMAAWAQRVGARERTTFRALEIERNLPPSWRDPASSGLTRGR